MRPGHPRAQALPVVQFQKAQGTGSILAKSRRARPDKCLVRLKMTVSNNHQLALKLEAGARIAEGVPDIRFFAHEKFLDPFGKWSGPFWRFFHLPLWEEAEKRKAADQVLASGNS